MTKVLDLASPAEITAHSYHIGMRKRVGRKDGQMKREAVGRLRERERDLFNNLA